MAPFRLASAHKQPDLDSARSPICQATEIIRVGCEIVASRATGQLSAKMSNTKQSARREICVSTLSNLLLYEIENKQAEKHETLQLTHHVLVVA